MIAEFNPLLVGMGQLLQTHASYLPRVAVCKDCDSADPDDVSHLELVLKMGGKLLKPDPETKQSALSVAIQLDHIAAVRFLLKHCGKEETRKALHMKDCDGEAPLDCLSRKNKSLAAKAMKAELEKIL